MTLLLVLVGVAAAVLVLGAVLLYLRRRLVRDPFAPGRGRTVAGAVAAGLLGLVIGCLLLGNLGPDAVAGLLVPGWLGLSVVLYLLLSLLVLELPRRALRRWSTGPARTHAHGHAHGHDHAHGHGHDGSHDHDQVGAYAPDHPHPHAHAQGHDHAHGHGHGHDGSHDHDQVGAYAPDHGATDDDDHLGAHAHAHADDHGGASDREGAHDHPHGGEAGGSGAGAVAVDPVDPGRRLVLNRALAGTAGAVAVATTGFGFVRARTVKTKPVTVPLARLDPAADGLRIALLSDIHLTRGLRERSWTAQTVATVNRADVDLVAIVGDLVDGSVAELGEFAAPLRDLRAPLGTFFVTGNHEYFSGADEWAAFLPELGVRVLRNERVELRHRGVVIDLAGVDDVAGERYSGGPDLPRALADRDPDRPVILLAHQPVLAEDAAAAGVDLQLSGHTHGGQLWPLHYLVRLQQGHLAGLDRIGDTVLYTTRGVGTWGPPVRVGAPPEITVLTLRSG